MFIRRLPKFEYHTPLTTEDALDLLSEFGERGRVLAGGTDLLVAMKFRRDTPEHLINIKAIEELKGISVGKSDLIRIGGLTTLGDIERSEIVRTKLHVLWDAVRVMASVQIRNLGTVGGNLCSAWPSADTAPPLIALGASVKVRGTHGERTVLLEDFFQGPGKIDKKRDEILTEVQIPSRKDNSSGAYLKLMRRNAMDLAIVGVAAQIELDANRKKCNMARIALGAVSNTPVRAKASEEAIMHKPFDAERAAEAGKIASENVSPRSSIRASGEYRKEMVGVQVRKALMTAFERIQNQ
jgi:carbon-monoxide dehydrogenase medium subunit